MDILTQKLKINGIKTCPINNPLQIIGKKFTILILRNMFLYKQTKFNQFLESVEGINSKSLSLRLHQLKSSDIIKRQVIPEVPIRIEYSLTEKGNALMPILEQLDEFSTQHCSVNIFTDKKPRPFKQIMATINEVF
jgi:DNA-binding HxlR family transcriptional regulator